MTDLSESKLAEIAAGRFAETIGCAEAFIRDNAALVGRAAEAVAKRLSAGGKLLVFGNGGSAADAQHIAAEFVNRLLVDRAALPAIALTTDSSVLTSIANDRSFDVVFSRQIEALGRRGDVAWGISTSGRSENVLAALRLATDKGLLTLFSAGEGVRRVSISADFVFIVPGKSSPRIQEVQMMLAHTLCELVEALVFERER